MLKLHTPRFNYALTDHKDDHTKSEEPLHSTPFITPPDGCEALVRPIQNVNRLCVLIRARDAVG